jgi:hypothetical protein
VLQNGSIFRFEPFRVFSAVRCASRVGLSLSGRARARALDASLAGWDVGFDGAAGSGRNAGGGTCFRSAPFRQEPAVSRHPRSRLGPLVSCVNAELRGWRRGRAVACAHGHQSGADEGQCDADRGCGQT